VVVLVLAPFVVAGIYLVIRFWHRFRPALERQARWLGQVVTAALLVGMALSSERLLKLPAVEEACEAGFTLVALLLVWELRVRQSKTDAA